jgi:hypothetical protein
VKEGGVIYRINRPVLTDHSRSRAFSFDIAASMQPSAAGVRNLLQSGRGLGREKTRAEETVVNHADEKQ